MTIRHPEKVRNVDVPLKKKPSWIKVKVINSENYLITKDILKKNHLFTVCE